MIKTDRRRILQQGSTDKDAAPVGETREQSFEQLVQALRPKLHRYCARMTGSVIDGEDVVQEALPKALEAFPHAGPLANPEGWVFRIASNAAKDFLRRRARHRATHSDEDFEMIAAPENRIENRQIAAAGLRTFMRLPAAQRSSVILRDVLGYSVEEICAMLDATIPAVKGALQRGRIRLRELALEPDEIAAPALAAPERARLLAYIARFNARDFDGMRAMLADDVRLELVNRLRLQGKGEVASRYFHGYTQAPTRWRCVPGFVDGRPAILMFDPDDPAGRPSYFILLEWAHGEIAAIRDFHFARYAIEDAEIGTLAGEEGAAGRAR